QMRSPAFVEKFKKGPVMMFTVMPGGSMAMGKNLIQWFLFSVVVGIFAALVAGSALPPGASSRAAVHFAGLTAFVAYTLALWPMSIWYRRSWITTIKATVDGLIYALLTAGVFAWLWPH
ncbi:MAG TPA: hypothetical protein VEM27_10705, partial [Gemmatimonadales bacterium]|nr:hypothetical protein [Gemmatimonadales bacterium]